MTKAKSSGGYHSNTHNSANVQDSIDGRLGNAAGRYNISPTYERGVNPGFTEVDPDLIAALQSAAMAEPGYVEGSSGYAVHRNKAGKVTGNHDKKVATDQGLYDAAGNLLDNGSSLQNRPAYRHYDEHVFQSLMQIDPAKAKAYRAGTDYKTTPLDDMHTDLSGGTPGKPFQDQWGKSWAALQKDGHLPAEYEAENMQKTFSKQFDINNQGLNGPHRQVRGSWAEREVNPASYTTSPPRLAKDVPAPGISTPGLLSAPHRMKDGVETLSMNVPGDFDMLNPNTMTTLDRRPPVTAPMLSSTLQSVVDPYDYNSPSMVPPADVPNVTPGVTTPGLASPTALASAAVDPKSANAARAAAAAPVAPVAPAAPQQDNSAVGIENALNPLQQGFKPVTPGNVAPQQAPASQVDAAIHELQKSLTTGASPAAAPAPAAPSAPNGGQSAPMGAALGNFGGYQSAPSPAPSPSGNDVSRTLQDMQARIGSDTGNASRDFSDRYGSGDVGSTAAAYTGDAFAKSGMAPLSASSAIQQAMTPSYHYESQTVANPAYASWAANAQKEMQDYDPMSADVGAGAALGYQSPTPGSWDTAFGTPAKAPPKTITQKVKVADAAVDDSMDPAYDDPYPEEQQPGLLDKAKKVLSPAATGYTVAGLPGALAGGVIGALGLNTLSGFNSMFGGPQPHPGAPAATQADVIGANGSTGKQTHDNGVLGQVNAMGYGPAPQGYHYGWSPVGGVALVSQNAPENLQIAASGSGILGALGLANQTGYTGPTTMAGAGKSVLGAIASALGLGSSNGGGSTNWGGVMGDFNADNSAVAQAAQAFMGGGNSGGYNSGGYHASESGNLHG